MTVLAVSVTAGAQGLRRQPTPNDTLQSVRILPDGKVLFQIYAPKARTVSVTGDLPWDKPVVFKENRNGVWQGVCEGVADGCFRYSFVVDGTRVQDPKAPLSAEQTSIFTKGPGYIKDVPHGAVAQRFYWSETLGQMRRMEDGPNDCSNAKRYHPNQGYDGRSTPFRRRYGQEHHSFHRSQL